MISFSIDKQRDKVNAEWMSRPVDSLKNQTTNQPLALVLISMAQSPIFAYRLKRKLLSGPIFGEAYKLVMDSDKRFAIRTRFVEKEVKTDSMTFFMQGGQTNKGIGKWSDLGGKFELKFQLGTVDSFFDKEENKENINIIDKYTLHLDKTADKVWIWKTLCKK